MKIHWAPVLAALAFLVTTSPALAKNGNSNGNGKGHAYGHSNGNANGHGKGAKGTPAPIAGLGVLALGAIGYGTHKLRRNKQK